MENNSASNAEKITRNEERISDLEIEFKTLMKRNTTGGLPTAMASVTMNDVPTSILSRKSLDTSFINTESGRSLL